MAFSFTGIAYLLGFLAAGLLSRRFYQYWQREKSIASKLFFYFTGFLAFFLFTATIPCLFFANNSQILRGVVITATFFQALALSVAGYLICYLKLPKVSPWLGFAAVLLLGLWAVILTIIIPSYPYLESGGGINWDIQPLVNILRSFLFLITFIPLSLILIQQTKTSPDPLAKTRALGLGITLVLGAVAGFFDFFLEPMFQLKTISSDIAMGMMSIIAVAILLPFRKPSFPKKEKKNISSSSQIPW